MPMQNLTKHDAIASFTEKATFFREINVFNKDITKELISRIFFHVILFFPHTTDLGRLIANFNFQCYSRKIHNSDAI